MVSLTPMVRSQKINGDSDPMLIPW